MAQRQRFAQAITLLLVVPLLLVACKPRHKSSAIVVHLLRNLNSPYGSDLDRRILDYQGSNPRLSSGQPITVESDTGDYKQMLEKQTSSNTDVDLIVLDSADDAKSNPALLVQLPSAVNVCAGLKACPTAIPSIIPSQIGGDDREAAQSFQNFLSKAP
ncbi:MAG TPA: hypothetical protein VK976_17415 [Verrucomicrobiae bacterium]|jgi:hypothetical protein|nr:hypothetical protein [Verrucomicrobiae bacterium]